MKLVHGGIANNFCSVKKNIHKYFATTALTATGLMIAAAPALADNWVDHVATEGSISIDTTVPSTTNITQHTNLAKVSGDGDISSGWTVNVAQPSSNSKYVLYDIEGDPTKIQGNLNSNGRIYIFDKNGVIFGNGSQVNVGSIVATSGKISDENIKNGADKIEFDGTEGAVVNNGEITVAEAGIAALVAPQVINNGKIIAQKGSVVLASGQKVTLDMYGDNLVSVATDGELENALIENKGSIEAMGGLVVMDVKTAKNAIDNVVNMDGMVDVSSVSLKGGKIIINGGNKGVTKVSGKIKANGKDGGTVDIKGQNINLTETSEISANSVASGNGGNVNIVAQNGLVFGGHISSKGGALSGNGGFVDTSGRGWVDIYGHVDASATNGSNGQWLIDPSDLYIASAGAQNIGGAGSIGSPFAPDGDFVSILRVESIEAALNLGNDVYVTTVGTPNKAFQDGTIRINASITKNAGIASTLFLNAAGSILVNNGSNITAANSTELGLDFNAAKSIFINGSTIATGGGDISLTAGDLVEIGALSQINTNGGNFDAIVNSIKFFIGNGSAVNTSGGDIAVRADGPVIELFGAPLTGNIFVNGILNAGGGGIDMHQSGTFHGDADSLRTSGTGTISINQNDFGIFGSIQNAIDAIQNIGTGLNTVSVSSGTFNESIEIAENNFLLKGANYNIDPRFGGRGAESVIDPNSPGFHVTGDNVEINGFLITGATGLDGYGVLVEFANNTAIKNNIINDTDADGIKVLGSNNFEASRNEIDDTKGNGIWVDSSGGLINVHRNNIGLNATSAVVDGIYGDGIEISGIGGNAFVSYNQITNTWDPTKNDTNNNSSGIYLRNSSNVIVDHNNIWKVDWDGIKLGGGTGNKVEYNFINTTTRIGIYGEGTNNATVHENIVSHANLNNWGAITILDGDDHTISANNVTGPASGADSGIFMGVGAGGNNRIIDNIIHDIKGTGIDVSSVTNVAITGNTITKTSHIEGNGYGDGIRVRNSSGNIQINDNDIGSPADMHKIEGNGIYLSGINGATIKGNQIWNTKASDPFVGDDASGIYLDNVSNVTVGGLGEENIVRNADWDGIKSKNGANHIIQANDIENSTRIGIYSENTENITIVDNLVHDSNLEWWGGITVLGGASHEVGRNTVWDDVDSKSDHGIYFAFNKGDNDIFDNIIFDINTGDGIHVRDTAAGFDISGNTITNVADDAIEINNVGSAIIQDNIATNAVSRGIYASGWSNGDIIVSGNSFSNFDTGAEFESGLIDLRGTGNTFDNGRIGLKFAPYVLKGGAGPTFANLDLVDGDAPGSTPHPTIPVNFGGTIGSQTFIGFTDVGDFYVYLGEEAFTNGVTPIWLNGLNSSYDGILPSSTGGALAQSQLDFLEARFQHFPDDATTDVFWFGFLEEPQDLSLIEQSLIFNRFNSFNGDVTGLNVRIVSLPAIPGGGAPAPQGPANFVFAENQTDAAALNQIATAAGGENQPSNNPDDLNEVEPAAGEEATATQDQQCWGSAVAAAGQGQVVNVIYRGGFAANLDQAAACGTGF